MRRSEVCFALAAALLLARPAVSHAQGYGVYEQGACTMGRGGTAAARPCADASGMYFNPAGIAGLPTSGSLGGTVIMPFTTWSNDNTQIQADFLSKAYPVPNLYFVAPVAKRYALGFGVYVPYGLTTEWDKETFEGRFLGYKTSLKAIYLQPTAAAQFGKFKIGAGLDITHLSVDLERKLDLSQQFAAPGVTFGMLGIPYGTDFADANITGSAWGVGYNLGATFDLTKQVSLGVRYLGRQKVTADGGEAQFTQDPTGLVLTAGNPLGFPAGTPVDALLAPQFETGGSLVTQGVSTSIRLPNQLVMGVAVTPVKALTVMFDAQYTWWEVLDEIPLDFEILPNQSLVLNDNSVWTWRFGAELLLNKEHGTVFRGGFIFHEAAAPDQSVIPNLPEASRNDYSVGFGTRISKTFYIDAAYMLVDAYNRRGRTVALEPGGPITNGLYFNAGANLVSVTLTATF
ncbi:MAG: fadL [Gemmatimonadetes bacterium]|nr:fadL [Gemmatimonadota bacterium]